MATSKLSTRFNSLLLLIERRTSSLRCNHHLCRRKASSFTGMEELSEDIEPLSSLSVLPTKKIIQSWKPVQRRKSRQLPPSRYQYRSPRYYRGPLHPHQPPPPSDPSSRLFIPGPFSLPRLKQTYTSTLAPDLLTLLYKHHPPGTLPGPAAERLRSWEGPSPYFKNRPLRAPRGAPTLNLMRRPITFRNVPTLEKITVHSRVDGASADPTLLPVAGMAVQAITNVRCTVYKAKKSMPRYEVQAGRPIAVACELRGEDMWCFLAKVVEVVMPRIKDFRGVSGGSGDNSGNLAFGFNSDIVGTFPEIEINYDSYPPKMIPGIAIMVCTTASNDKEARLLLSSLGIPFFGKHIN